MAVSFDNPPSISQLVPKLEQKKDDTKILGDTYLHGLDCGGPDEP